MSVPAGSSRSPVEEALDHVEKVTGPLAPLFAQVREALELAKDTPFGVPEAHLESLRRLDALCPEALAALSSIERHVQDRSPVEEALDRLESTLRMYGHGPVSLSHVITVRAELDSLTAQVERLTEERDGERAAKLRVAQDWRAAEAEVQRLTGLLEHTTEGLRERIERLQALVRDRPRDTEARDTYADGVTAGAMANECVLDLIEEADVLALVEIAKAAQPMADLPWPLSADERQEWIVKQNLLRSALARLDSGAADRVGG